MIKILLGSLASIIFASSVYGFTFDSCQYPTIQEADNANVDTTYQQSASMLTISNNLLSVSTQLLANPSSVNITYVNAMLQLSKDILEMADKIGEMADRIVATELQIGIMADRILQTQQLQSNNLALTQANLLQAQKNFGDVLIALSR